MFPANARRPASISYRTAPKLKMSDRASTGWPSACSGDMYAAGPEHRARVVSVTSAAAVQRLATPKSSSFAVPPAVTMMFAGFRSRWRMPCSCARCNAPAIWIADADRVFRGSGPRSG